MLYYDGGATVEFGHDLTEDQMERMKAGEIFTVMKDGKPDRRILWREMFEDIACGEIENPMGFMSWMMFGVCISYYASKEYLDAFTAMVNNRDDQANLS